MFRQKDNRAEWESKVGTKATQFAGRTAMFQLIQATAEKRKLQQGFRQIFENALAPQGKRVVGHPGGGAEVALFSSGTGKLWCGFRHDTESRIFRYWNPFGIFQPNKSVQTITAEINIPINTNGQQVAGFFARDTDSGLTYLMHTGRIGGRGSFSRGAN
jgi:hypothetical protein